MGSLREKDIERKLAEAARKAGGLGLKFISPGHDGMPDRMVLLPYGKLGFVEVKAPGKRPRPLQTAKHRLLRRLGFQVYVLDRAEDIPRILDGIGGRDGHDLTE